MSTRSTKRRKAPLPGRQRPGRLLLVLALLVAVLFGTVGAGVKWGSAAWSPGLALDLEGGTQVVLTPRSTNNQSVTQEQLERAATIISQRVDSTGVSEAQVQVQGGRNVSVSVPGVATRRQLDLIKQSAQLRMRSVIAVSAPTSSALTPPGQDPAAPSPTTTPAPTPSASPSVGPGQPTDSPTVEPTSNSDVSLLTPDVQRLYATLDCTNPDNQQGGLADDPTKVLVTCDRDGSAKYVLGPVEVEGTEIKTASSTQGTNSQGLSTGQWIVDMQFTSQGGTQFRDVTGRISQLPSPQNQFAIVLDGLVVSAPSVSETITGGRAQISGGGFTQESTEALASQLRFGALPLSFEVQTEEQVSATLGSEQLQRGLLAGLIGLLLVVVYSVVQYRALGLVIVSSLVLAAIVNYGVILLLSWTQDFRLSLAGVAGLIVAIGVTADSFILLFERVRDELREGRALSSAVAVGWRRARRTIVISDVVSLMSAVVLYVLAVGNVRGFAYTLGITTIIDLAIVALFTYPFLAVIARWKFFASGHRLSGFDARQLGGAFAKNGLHSGARMTIAQRRAAERSSQEPTTTIPKEDDNVQDTMEGEGR